MNKRLTLCSLMIAAGALALPALSADTTYAQADPPAGDVRRPAPRRDGEGAAGGPARGDRPERGDRFDPQDRPPRPEGGMGGGPGMNEGRPGDGLGPLGPRPLRPIGPGATADNLRNYLEMVDRYNQVSKDPASAGVAAVMSTVDVLRPRGAQAAIDYFTKVLPNVKNDSVSRAIRLQLVELYKVTKQDEKALDLLEKLMTEAPASTGTR